MMKRTWLIQATFFAIALACTGGLVFAGGQSEASSEVGTEQITLEVWQHKEAATNSMTEMVIERFEQEYPNIDIVFEVFEEVAGYNTKLVTSIAGGGGPDVFDINAVTGGAYNARGILKPIDFAATKYGTLEPFEELYETGALNAFKDADGRLLGVPFELSPWQLYVNTEYADKAGVSFPTDSFITWEEFYELTSEIHRANSTGGKTVKGYQLPFGGPFGWYLIVFQPMLWQNGGSVFTPDQQSNVDSAAMRRAIQIWSDIYSTYDTGSTSEFPGANPVFEFAQGESATTIAGPWALGTIQNVNPDLVEDVKVVPLPQVDPENPAIALNSWGFFINKNTEKAEAASQFITFFVENGLDGFLQGGPMMPTKAVFSSPEAQSRPGFEVFRDGLAYGRAREGTPYYDETGEAIKSAIDSIVLLGRDPEDVIAELDAELNRIQNQ